MPSCGASRGCPSLDNPSLLTGVLSCVPWPASKKTKRLINRSIMVIKNRGYHATYQAEVSQFRFESASGRVCEIGSNSRQFLERGYNIALNPWPISSYSTWPSARQSHNLELGGSNPFPATTFIITHSPSRSNDRDGLGDF